MRLEQQVLQNRGSGASGEGNQQGGTDVRVGHGLAHIEQIHRVPGEGGKEAADGIGSAAPVGADADQFLAHEVLDSL